MAGKLELGMISSTWLGTSIEDAYGATAESMRNVGVRP